MNEVGNILLDYLSPADYALLRPHLTKVTLEQGVVLQRPKEIIKHVYFPTEGMVSLVSDFVSGDSVEIAAIGNEAAVGTKLGRYPQYAFARAVVQLPGKAVRMELTKFLELAAKSVGITHIATCANDVMIANLQQSAGCNAYHGVEARLARWLLQSRDHFDSDVLPLTQQFLSQMLGSRRTTVQLAAATLEKLGAIDYKRGKIYIKDRRVLEGAACECYQAVTTNVQLICELARASS